MNHKKMNNRYVKGRTEIVNFLAKKKLGNERSKWTSHFLDFYLKRMGVNQRKYMERLGKYVEESKNRIEHEGKKAREIYEKLLERYMKRLQRNTNEKKFLMNCAKYIRYYLILN